MNSFRFKYFLSILTLLVLTSFQDLNGQVYYSRTGHVHVSSENDLKEIEADNYQVISTIDFSTGKVRFEALLKSFEFRLGALDRVFNSERINVNQYPKIRFEGRLRKFRKIKLDDNQTKTVDVVGILYIWDEKRKTSAKGTLKLNKNGEIEAISNFKITIEEASMNKLNNLIDSKLPDIINLSTESFGVSRDINIELDVTYMPRTW